MVRLTFPAIPEMSRNGNAGFSRDSRALYKRAGTPGGKKQENQNWRSKP